VGSTWQQRRQQPQGLLQLLLLVPLLLLRQ